MEQISKYLHALPSPPPRPSTPTITRIKSGGLIPDADEGEAGAGISRDGRHSLSSLVKLISI